MIRRTKLAAFRSPFTSLDLPLDVLPPILAQLSDHTDWHACALVSKIFNRVATPLLYRTLDSRIISKVSLLNAKVYFSIRELELDMLVAWHLWYHRQSCCCTIQRTDTILSSYFCSPSFITLRQLSSKDPTLHNMCGTSQKLVRCSHPS